MLLYRGQPGLRSGQSNAVCYTCFISHKGANDLDAFWSKIKE